jgi:putative transposase
MPRRRRFIAAGGCYHVINRGNNRATVFDRPSDYKAFAYLIRDAQERGPLDLLAACLMPNHFHLVVRPHGRDDIGRWMHWLLTTHSHRYHLARGTSGRVWQGPYKAFPVERDLHLFTVMRYVERNAVRAGLVGRARDWCWSSASWRHGPAWLAALIVEPPVARPLNWDGFLDQPQTLEELESVRTCVNRQCPFGSQAWLKSAAECQWYEPPVRKRGRPRKKNAPVPPGNR